jgi:acetyl-CoA carboxylase biotin carboxylase subunit
MAGSNGLPGFGAGPSVPQLRFPPVDQAHLMQQPASDPRILFLGMVTGIDLVNEQIRIAAGTPLSITQKEVVFEGHAIECRVNAENPRTFAPSPGRISYYYPPGGLGVRIDSAIYQGYTIPPFYDSLIGKLIVHGKTRNECLSRLRRSLDEFVVDGIETTLPLFRALVRNQDIINGDYNIHWLERYLADS